jgi:HAD superfamily hydrolase (TIGR01490 family)
MMIDHIAFFDLDNTIIHSNSGIFFIQHAHREGLLSKRDLARAFSLSVGYKLGLIRAEKIINRMSMWLKGIPEKQIIELASQVFHFSVKEAFRRQAMSAIDWHKQNGGRAVLLSAASSYLCAHVKDFIRLDDVICTELEVSDGHFTGRPLGNYCYGREKLVRMRKYCAEIACPLEKVYYYADSYSDLPVLEAVGYPVCITPDSRLLKTARKKSWAVYSW